MSPRRVVQSRLPANLNDIRGLRAARWVRESTAEQFDHYGPSAQANLIDGAVARFDLVDTGIGWTVAASGWTQVWLTPEWADMLASARRGDFDLLVVGYVSRFTRKVKETLVTIEDELHPAGVAVLFADEKLLSSDPNEYHDLVDEANDAQLFSWKMATRQREGHKAKRRRGEPGGRPPFGFARDGGRSPILVEVPSAMDVVRSIFRWAAEGFPDREVAARANLKKTRVSEILTNPIYNGRLRDGNRRSAVIDDELWNQVQELRSHHARRHPGPTTYRQYLLSGLLHCRSCDRRLTGHVNRYRHIDACPTFRAARPGGSDLRHLGDSYTAATYDRIVPGLLAHIVANASLIAEVETALDDQQEFMPDQFALARIRRDRERALTRLQVDRNVAAWQVVTDRLDREEAEAQAISTPTVSAQDVAAALADMATLFRDAEPTTQHRIARALFDKIEALGPKEIWIFPSVEAEARGWATAMSGVTNVDGATVWFVRRSEAQMSGVAAS